VSPSAKFDRHDSPRYSVHIIDTRIGQVYFAMTCGVNAQQACHSLAGNSFGSVAVCMKLHILIFAAGLCSDRTTRFPSSARTNCLGAYHDEPDLGSMCGTQIWQHLTHASLLTVMIFYCEYRCDRLVNITFRWFRVKMLAIGPSSFGFQRHCRIPYWEIPTGS
jgi:hypothetical protein